MRSLLRILSFTMLLLAGTVSVWAGEWLPFESAGANELRWRKTRIPVAISTSLLRPHPAIRPDSDIQGAIRRSLAAWESVADVDFELVWTDKTSVSPAGKSGDGLSLITVAQTTENLVMFGGDAADSSARTRVFFNGRREISEADIVFNPYQQFSTDGSFGTFDFESVLTHELGHLLGLEHSELLASTMYERQGKNGTFGLASFGPRTLSDDDVARVRGIYGHLSDAACCGEVDGKLIFSPNGINRLQVWLEDAETGRVAASTNASTDGVFKFRGLSNGRYRVFAQDYAGVYSGLDLGELTLRSGRPVSFSRKIELTERRFSVLETGFNGQLVALPILLNRGKNYLIYAGGSELRATGMKVSSTAPGIIVKSLGTPNLDYGEDVSVISFESEPSETVPNGEYTLTIRSVDGGVQYLPGRLTVESFNNPWVTAAFD